MGRSAPIGKASAQASAAVTDCARCANANARTASGQDGTGCASQSAGCHAGIDSANRRRTSGASRAKAGRSQAGSCAGGNAAPTTCALAGLAGHAAPELAGTGGVIVGRTGVRRGVEPARRKTPRTLFARPVRPYGRFLSDAAL